MSVLQAMIYGAVCVAVGGGLGYWVGHSGWAAVKAEIATLKQHVTDEVNKLRGKQ